MADDDHRALGPFTPLAIDPIRDALITPCFYWLNKLRAKAAHAIGADIVDAFWDWRDRQADSSGNVKVISEGGLLVPRTEQTIPIAGLKPWECAGPLVKNDIDLAFKLWLDDDQRFATVTSAHGLETVFSIIGISTKVASRNSLIRLNGLLVRSVLFELDIANRIGKELFDKHKTRERQAKENLARARAKRNQDRKQASDETTSQYRKVAFDYAFKNPTADQTTVIDHLQKVGLPKRTPSTIKRLIAGVMGEAKGAPRPRPTLYATEHKSIR